MKNLLNFLSIGSRTKKTVPTTRHTDAYLADPLAAITPLIGTKKIPEWLIKAREVEEKLGKADYSRWAEENNLIG